MRSKCYTGSKNDGLPTPTKGVLLLQFVKKKKKKKKDFYKPRSREIMFGSVRLSIWNFVCLSVGAVAWVQSETKVSVYLSVIKGCLQSALHSGQFNMYITNWSQWFTFNLIHALMITTCDAFIMMLMNWNIKCDLNMIKILNVQFMQKWCFPSNICFCSFKFVKEMLRCYFDNIDRKCFLTWSVYFLCM